MIYLASPYSHPDPKVREARWREACRTAAFLMKGGQFVFSPIAHRHPIAEFGLPGGWEFWERFDREMLPVRHNMPGREMLDELARELKWIALDNGTSA